MTKLDKLIESRNLEKQNSRNRLADKSRHQEFFGEREELFDPLTKTLNARKNKASSLKRNISSIRH